MIDIWGQSKEFWGQSKNTDRLADGTSLFKYFYSDPKIPDGASLFKYFYSDPKIPDPIYLSRTWKL